jgi:hypothetical protein
MQQLPASARILSLGHLVESFLCLPLLADPKEYIHRVGRTARGASGSGKALLFLLPEELGFLKYLRAAKVALNEYEFPEVRWRQLCRVLCAFQGLHVILRQWFL